MVYNCFINMDNPDSELASSWCCELVQQGCGSGCGVPIPTLPPAARIYDHLWTFLMTINRFPVGS